MKKMIGISLLLSVGLLLFSKGSYVEWGELTVVIFASCFIAFLLAIRDNKRKDAQHYIVALAAFGLFWVLSFIDLIGDHVFYHLPQEGVFYDGRPLTLGEKIREFNDDLLAVSWISPCVSLILSLALSFFRYRNRKES